MKVPEQCVQTIIDDKGKLWEGEYASEVFWTVAENLYDAARKNNECFEQLKEVDKVTFRELYAAFKPDRDPVDVMWTGDKMWSLAKKIVDNGNLFNFSTPPSCAGVGLEKVSEVGTDEFPEKCMLYHCDAREVPYEIGKLPSEVSEEEIMRIIENECHMECDCPDGWKYFNPLEYAYDNVVFRDGDRVKMYYSDYPYQLADCVRAYERARAKGDVSEMVIALDCMVNAAHMSGSLAEFLVEGGVQTLDRLKEVSY